jgi:SAM-dependent methyltransferase
MKIMYEKEKRRLVYAGESSSPDFWNSHWDLEDFRESIEREKNSRFILKILRKYVPDKKGRILEGGCGKGQVVYCMHVHGYESVGIDFAEKTVERTKELFPYLDIRVGDVRDLQFPDDYFLGYWSLGVIEHFQEGHHDILKEMKRVLVNRGYLFLNFPYMSCLRKLKAKLGLYKQFTGGGVESFYQYVLDGDTVIREFESNGFKLIGKKPYSGIKGFKDEVAVFRSLLQRLFDYKGKNLWVRGLRYIFDIVLAFFAGHMILLVLRNMK